MIVGQAQRGGLDQAIGGQVQRAAVLGAHPGQRGGFRVVLVAQVDVLDPVVVADRVVDELQRLAVALDDAQEAGAELMRGIDTGPAEQLDIQLAAQVDVLRDVDRHLRVHVLRVPDAQLSR
ncbi:hypothetical protein NG2371_00957 [Nocardia gamkensis]|nr:hypothetical protein [Nocardia gamkensis]